MNDKYRAHVAKRYAPFIKYVTLHAYDKPVIAEMGCGAANVSRILSQSIDAEQILVDKCPRMLKLADINMTGSSKYTLVQADLTRSLSFLQDRDVGLMYAHGVLEHFSDFQIRKILAGQKKITDTIIHYVPSNKYEKPSFGDERLMSPEQWYDICQPDSIIEFNDGYDLILSWK